MRLVAGHAVFIMPVVMLIVLARLNGLDPSLEDASSDLGATRGQTLRRIILPLIRTAIIGAALLGFTLSFDEMIISLFLTGAEPTLPIFIWNQLRFGFTPEINAIFAIITLVSLVAIAVATRVIGGERTRPPA
jgi:spermidine/putrescine transport system permease protein